MSTIQILVDDTDPRIIYSPEGSWSQRGKGNPYEHGTITHRVQDDTGDVHFTFNGTKIDLYVTIPEHTASSAPVACFVDGNTISSWTTTTNNTSYHYLQCSSPNLTDDREHTLSVTVNAKGTAWYLDYLIYETLPSQDRLPGPSDAPLQLMIDDTDARFTFDGPLSNSWKEGGVPGEYNDTTHFTVSSNSKATISFYGTSIQLYGTGDPSVPGPSAAYSIDGKDSITVTSTDIGAPSGYQVQFFKSDMLEEGNHTLAVTNLLQGAGKFILDFALVSVSPYTLVALYSNSSSSPPGETTPPGKTDSPGEINPQRTRDRQSPNVAVIAGITVGAVMFVVLLILGVLVLRKRLRRNSKNPDLPQVNPFPLGSTASSHSSVPIIKSPFAARSTPVGRINRKMGEKRSQLLLDGNDLSDSRSRMPSDSAGWSPHQEGYQGLRTNNGTPLHEEPPDYQSTC